MTPASSAQRPERSAGLHRAVPQPAPQCGAAPGLTGHSDPRAHARPRGHRHARRGGRAHLPVRTRDRARSRASIRAPIGSAAWCCATGPADDWLSRPAAPSTSACPRAATRSKCITPMPATPPRRPRWCSFSRSGADRGTAGVGQLRRLQLQQFAPAHRPDVRRPRLEQLHVRIDADVESCSFIGATLNGTDWTAALLRNDTFTGAAMQQAFLSSDAPAPTNIFSVRLPRRRSHRRLLRLHHAVQCDLRRSRPDPGGQSLEHLMEDADPGPCFVTQCRAGRLSQRQPERRALPWHPNLGERLLRRLAQRCQPDRRAGRLRSVRQQSARGDHVRRRSASSVPNPTAGARPTSRMPFSRRRRGHRCSFRDRSSPASCSTTRSSRAASLTATTCPAPTSPAPI